MGKGFLVVAWSGCSLLAGCAHESTSMVIVNGTQQQLSEVDCRYNNDRDSASAGSLSPGQSKMTSYIPVPRENLSLQWVGGERYEAQLPMKDSYLIKDGVIVLQILPDSKVSIRAQNRTEFLGELTHPLGDVYMGTRKSLEK